MEKVIVAFIFLVLLGSAGMCIAVDSRISTVDYEMKQQIQMQKLEIEELKKNQRITTQDIQFLENLVVEKE